MTTIFFVINRLGGKGWGGAHRVMAILANYLARKKYNVKIIVWEKTKIEYPLDQKIEVICLGLKVENEFKRMQACIKTRSILKKYPNTIVYAFTSRIAVDVLLSSIFLKIKVIGSERTNPRVEPKKKLFRFFRNIIFCFMYKIVFQTYDALNYFPKAVRKKSVVIPNPLSPTLIKPYNGIRTKEFVTFCRIDKQKNLPLLINSFIKVHQKHPEYSLKIYGSGLLENEIRALIKKKDVGAYIKMYDFSSNIHEKIKNSFAYINSSDYEGMSNSMLEALAIGIPSICTDCPIGGAKMVIKNMNNGILVPVNNEDKMIEAMNLLIENQKLAKRFSRESIKIRKELEEAKICLRWEELLFEKDKK